MSLDRDSVPYLYHRPAMGGGGRLGLVVDNQLVPRDLRPSFLGWKQFTRPSPPEHCYEMRQANEKRSRCSALELVIFRLHCVIVSRCLV